ncbi:cyclic nucleotide-binding domain-containing protein [Alkalihalobacterium elongatum]|uniref:cyclic nucleotide-binding domain-containing protein n=1 Tax=Alkalihalobacterium elongatum TaxID=2675466 RepID=UPI001C1F6453|nr:cyclic nucleotide-binding domain-containing protein [Alkalihalobacterium elongatum]
MSSSTINVFNEIKNNPLGADFTDDEVSIITKFSNVYMTEKDEYIIQEGDIEQSLFLIKTGSVGLYKEKKGERLLTVLKDGDLIGGFAQLDGERSTTAVKTRQPSLLIKINVKNLFNNPNYKSLQVKLLSKMVRQLSIDVEHKNEIIIEKEAKQLNALKSYKALGLLATNLLIVLSIYTLMLMSLTHFVDYHGVSTFVDVTLLIGFALVMYAILRKSGYPLKSFGLTLDKWKIHVKDAILLTLPVLFFFLVLKWSIITFIPTFSHIELFNPTAAFAEIGFSFSIFLITIIVYILFSVVQEFIARAGLQSAFYRFLPGSKGNHLKSVILSNLLFAMAHSHIGTLFALSAFIPGLFWGWMFARQKSFVGVCVSHMLIGIWVIFILGFTEFIIN